MTGKRMTKEREAELRALWTDATVIEILDGLAYERTRADILETPLQRAEREAYEAYDATLTKPVCTTCNDTHTMQLENQGDVPCTHCPLPCQECRFEGYGAYCQTLPCDCVCHAK